MSVNRSRPGVRAAMVALLCLTISACPNLMPEPAPPPRSFDFGPLPAHEPAPLPFAVGLGTVSAPSWLQGPDILYRRVHEQPGAIRPYAQNAWIAPPGELLAQRLRHMLATAAPEERRGREMLLRLELLAFEQVFERPDSAHVIVHALAMLDGLDAEPHERSFLLRRAATADVEGATRELPQAADDLIRELGEWLRGLGINASR
jgi:cholesterol transport system auxiliary component